MAIQNDQVVSMMYTLRDAETDEVLDSNEGGKPIEFLMGRGHIIPGLEEELKSLDNGANTKILVSSDKAYGVYDESLLQTHPREQFAGIELKEGMTLFGQGEDGSQVQVVVKSFSEDEVKIDFNHPLAGKDLAFEVDIVDVRDADENELATGVVAGMAGGCCGGDHGDGGCCGSHDHGEGGCCGGDHDEEESREGCSTGSPHVSA